MRKRVARPKRNAPVSQLVEFYLDSDRFRRLKGKTQKEYDTHLQRALATRVSHLNKTIGAIQISNLRLSHLREAYDVWLQTGIRNANYRAASMSAALSYAVECDLLEYNPIHGLRKQSTKPRRVRWEREQVVAFLDTAYSDFKWRSIGLIVHMAYEWAQRVGDMRTLTWDSLDLDAQRVDLTQSKRNAEVHLPISDGLTEMLKQQKHDFGFQQYVAPKPNPSCGAYVPYTIDLIDNALNDVKLAAGLPKHLTAMDLRRTAITEMAEAGVDVVGIRQVTGHANLQSVTPYLVNTYSGASAALAKRNGER
jgi:integrase